MHIIKKPLVEFGQPVSITFNGEEIPARRDANSGYVFFDPPSPDDLEAFYQSDYVKKQNGYWTVETDYQEAKNRYHAERILQHYNSVQGRMPATALELGCAYGGLVAEMQRRGISVTGADLSKNSIEAGQTLKGNKLIFQAGNMAALARQERPLDLIYAIHVLEHDAELINVIRTAAGHLANDGLIFISVPNAMFARSLIEGFKNNFWATYPDHLHMLSPGFLPALCDLTNTEPILLETKIFLGVDTDFSKQFNDDFHNDRTRNLWEMVMGTAGHGMEMNFMLARKSSLASSRHRKRSRHLRSKLDFMRECEVAIRDFLETA